ncbi:hypothetical protein HJFPF1_11864 [Paramyrothecium foliicola]|nr:hypothetical protein HJFPF1_11864 [Paramyrothecium foliicola]
MDPLFSSSSSGVCQPREMGSSSRTRPGWIPGGEGNDKKVTQENFSPPLSQPWFADPDSILPRDKFGYALPVTSVFDLDDAKGGPPHPLVKSVAEKEKKRKKSAALPVYGPARVKPPGGPGGGKRQKRKKEKAKCIKKMEFAGRDGRIGVEGVWKHMHLPRKPPAARSTSSIL